MRRPITFGTGRSTIPRGLGGRALSLLRLRDDPDSRFLRTFAVGWLVLFAVLGGGQWFVGNRATGAVLIAVGVGLGLPAVVWSEVARRLYRGWTTLLTPVAWVVSLVLLTFVYFVIVCPIAVVRRVVGRRGGLELQPDPAADSYWVPRSVATDPDRDFRQF